MSDHDQSRERMRPRRLPPTGHRGEHEQGRACGVCGERADRSVLIAAAGLVHIKDLCGRHLDSLMQGTRSSFSR